MEGIQYMKVAKEEFCQQFSFIGHAIYKSRPEKMSEQANKISFLNFIRVVTAAGRGDRVYSLKPIAYLPRSHYVSLNKGSNSTRLIRLKSLITRSSKTKTFPIRLFMNCVIHVHVDEFSSLLLVKERAFPQTLPIVLFLNQITQMMTKMKVLKESNPIRGCQFINSNRASCQMTYHKTNEWENT